MICEASSSRDKGQSETVSGAQHEFEIMQAVRLVFILAFNRNERRREGANRRYGHGRAGSRGKDGKE